MSLALGAFGFALTGQGCSSSNGTTAVVNSIDAGAGGSSGGTQPTDAASPWDGATATSCLPADVSTYKPTWRKPAEFYQGVCDAADLDAFRIACLGADASQCSKAVKADCAKCILTDESADLYGAVIAHKGWVELNLPGCVADAMQDPTGVRCGAAMQAVSMCELAACSANCPVSSDATLTLLESCRASVDKGQCQGLVTDAQCADSLADAGVTVAACVSGTTFAESYTAIATLFCLPNPQPAPVDAGGAGD